MVKHSCKKTLNSAARMLLIEERLQAGLTDDEHDFHAATEIGDLETIKRLVESGKVSITCMDLMGRTSLELATTANDTDLVRYFINCYPEHLIHSGFLCAVENDRDKLCEIYLAHEMYSLPVNMEGNKKKNGNVQKTQSEGPKSVQAMLREALIIAACRNNFLIVKMLMVRGVTLDIPHEYLCLCKACSESRNADFMTFTNNRLDAFRAIASPAYIALTEPDPIMAAFLLSDKFRKTAEIETEYKQVYFELDTQVQDFTLDLLATCRSSEEVRMLLGSNSKEESHANMPVINMALAYKQKKFLAHRKCQAQVAQLWFSGVPLLRYLNNFNYLMLSIPIGMIFIPILSIIYLFTGYYKIEQFLDTPIMRFLSYTTSYVSFLLLMVNSKLTMTRQWSQIACSEIELTTIIFITIVFLWLIGMIWEETKQLYEAGAVNYFSSIWNIVDSCMLSLLLCSAILDLVVGLKLKIIVQERHTTVINAVNVTYSLPICDYNPYSGIGAFCNIHRDYDFIVEWNPVWIPDPEMLSDICFSIGIVLSVSRIAFLMPCNETFGTMLVSFYRTLMDLFKLCGMFGLVILAFTCGIAALYDAMQCQSEAFGSPGGTMGYLVWGMFGMGESNAPDLKDNGAPLHSIVNNMEAKKDTIVAFGYALYGTFIFASTIVLMNLLIAVMANTFQEIQDEQESEWKFSRTELWLTFIEGGCPLPPPFNILPGAKQVKTICHKIFKFCYDNCPKDKDVSVIMDNTDDVKRMDDNESLNYVERKHVLTALVRRYIVQSTKEKLEDNEAGSDDVMRRLIENMGSKLVKKIEELRNNINAVEGDVNNVNSREVEIRKVQEEQTKLAESQIQMAKQIQIQIDQLAIVVKKALEPSAPVAAESDDNFIPKTKI